MNWLAVRLRPRSDERDAAIAALIDLGAGGVQEDGDALVTSFPETIGEDALRAALIGVAPHAAIDISNVPETDWLSRWRDGVTVHDVGGLAVAPPWMREGRDTDHTIFIEPAMAFGTGDHASTRGALRLLQFTIRPGDRAADLGAGSAVLAIAAAKLGAARVAAIELDPDAIGNATENVRENGVDDRVTVIEGDAAVLLPLIAPLDLVLANIISSVILELLQGIRGALANQGRAIFAGMLASERGMMLAAFEAEGWAVGLEDFEGEWWSVSVSRA